MSLRKRFRNIDDEITLAEIKQGDFILDYGCGPGYNTIPASRKIGNTGKVFALDISSDAIKSIEEKKKKYNLQNIETILSDCKINLKNKSIDIVYLHNTLPIVKNKKEVLDEIFRVLKIGGRLSYMSRFICRITGNDSMNNKQLTKHLTSDNKFKLMKSKKGHLIFKKN